MCTYFDELCDVRVGCISKTASFNLNHLYGAVAEMWCEYSKSCVSHDARLERKYLNT